MNRTPSLKPRQTAVSVPAHGDGRTAGSPVRLAFGIALWVIGLIILAALAFIVHVKAPWPFKLDFTKTIQGLHPIPCPVPVQPHSWLQAGLFAVSQLNNPISSVIAAVIWLIGMLLLRLLIGYSRLLEGDHWLLDVPEMERYWDQPYAAGRHERSEARGGILS